MSSSITEISTSSGFNDAATLFRISPQKELHVFVEDEEDIPFWRKCLECLAKDYYFVVTPYSKSGKALNGKSSMLKDVKDGILVLSSSAIVCIDSDYDLLIKEEYSDVINTNKWIINTGIFYAMENIKCHPNNIERITYQVCLKDYLKIDFEKSLEDFSNLYSELFLLTIASKKNKDANNVYSINSFSKDIQKLQFDSMGNIKEETEKYVSNRLRELADVFEANRDDMQRVSILFSQKSLPKNKYYYAMYGHAIEEYVAKTLVYCISDPIRKTFYNDVNSSAISDEEKQKRRERFACQTGVLEDEEKSLNKRILRLLKDCLTIECSDGFAQIQDQLQKTFVA